MGIGTLVQAITLLKRNFIASRGTAGLIGAALLMILVIPDAFLATMETPAPPGNLWLLYIGLSDLAFAFLGGAAKELAWREASA